MDPQTISAGGDSFGPEAKVNKPSKQPKRARSTTRGRRGAPACYFCRKGHIKCDVDVKFPCTNCEKGERDCVPASDPRFAAEANNNNNKRASSGATPGSFSLPNPRPSSAPQQPPPSEMSAAPRRTMAEQAIYDDRNRFDNSDSDEETEGIQLPIRGDWAQTPEDDLPSVPLPESTGGPDALPIPSSATPLTEVQVAVQAAPGGSKKKRRRPKKKTAQAAGIIPEPRAPTSSSSLPTTAATSFQTVTIEDDVEEITSAASSPPHDPELDIEKHYQDQPFLLCCPNISITFQNPDCDDLLSLAQRMAGMIPDHLVIGPKTAYGVVWCDYPIIFCLAYHHKPSNERGFNWYGTTSYLSGDITEIIYQAPEVMSPIEALKTEKECLIRSFNSVDFACSHHLDHTFTLYEVQWQAQGEARRREAIRKVCKAAGHDFATFLRADRIEKQHMHL